MKKFQKPIFITLFSCLNSTCENTIGGFKCNCNDGYVKMEFVDFCIEYDECIDNPCDRNAICTNTAGSYTCECKQGFEGGAQKLIFIITI